PELDADVEGNHVDDETVRRDREVLQLGREPEAVCEPEGEHGRLRARLEAEAAEPAQILERLVDHREPDDRVDDVGVDVQPAEHAGEERRAVTDREQRDVERYVLQPVQEEDDAGEKQQMVVSGDHVLRPEVHVGADVRTARAQQKGLVVARDAVREHARRRERARKQQAAREPAAELPVRRPHGGDCIARFGKTGRFGLDSGLVNPQRPCRSPSLLTPAPPTTRAVWSTRTTTRSWASPGTRLRTRSSAPTAALRASITRTSARSRTPRSASRR